MEKPGRLHPRAKSPASNFSPPAAPPSSPAPPAAAADPPPWPPRTAPLSPAAGSSPSPQGLLDGRPRGLTAVEVRDRAEAALYAPGWAGPAWMDTGDLAGGFRQLVHFPQFRLAVSRGDKLLGPVLEVCVPPVGWRVARAAELLAAGFRVDGGRQPVQYYYADQAGWAYVTRGAVHRLFFVTADFETVERSAGGVVLSYGYEGDLRTAVTAEHLRELLLERAFAGVVCVRDSPATPTLSAGVLEPARCPRTASRRGLPSRRKTGGNVLL